MLQDGECWQSHRYALAIYVYYGKDFMAYATRMASRFLTYISVVPHYSDIQIWYHVPQTPIRNF